MADRSAGYLAAANAAARLAQKSDTEQVWVGDEILVEEAVGNNKREYRFQLHFFMILDDIVNIHKLQKWWSMNLW